MTNNKRLTLAQEADLIDAITKLSNEADGFLYVALQGRISHTNTSILKERIDEARAAIAKVSEDVS